MADVKAAPQRPLSPHLQIYRPTLSMTMSIVHRITGAATYFGVVLLVAWLLSAASGPDAYETMQGWFGSILGYLVLFGMTWALIHHALGGVRHLIWDTIHGLDAPQRDWLVLATIVGSVSLTLLVWAIGLVLLP